MVPSPLACLRRGPYVERRRPSHFKRWCIASKMPCRSRSRPLVVVSSTCQLQITTSFPAVLKTPCKLVAAMSKQPGLDLAGIFCKCASFVASSGFELVVCCFSRGLSNLACFGLQRLGNHNTSQSCSKPFARRFSLSQCCAVRLHVSVHLASTGLPTMFCTSRARQLSERTLAKRLDDSCWALAEGAPTRQAHAQHARRNTLQASLKI